MNKTVHHIYRGESEKTRAGESPRHSCIRRHNAFSYLMLSLNNETRKEYG